jgi:hypothetical protein
MPARRTFAHLMLALALLLAQQLAAAHANAHLGGQKPPQDDQSRPAERGACVLCMVDASSAHALPATGHPPFVGEAQVLEPVVVTWTYYPPVSLAFSSRAPPVLL